MIDQAEVRRIAALSKLRFDAAQVTSFTSEFSTIVDFVARLATVPTDGIAPTYQVIEDEHVLRPDFPEPALSREDALRNAPAVREGNIVVPRVVE